MDEAKLRQKGWSEEELAHARIVLDKTESPLWVSVLYWTFLLLAIIANLFVSIVLFPLLIISKSGLLYLLVVMLGFVFGFVFSLILRDIDALDVRHHVIAGVFIPALAFVNVAYMTAVASRASVVLGIQATQNPLYVSLSYALAFIASFFGTRLLERKII